MINLNGEDFAEKKVSIFNDDTAGLAENVDVRVEFKQPGEPDSLPDFKLICSDDNGSVNQGFYYFTPNPSDTQERQKTRETQEVSRVLHVARAVLGEGYAFPEVSSAREAYDVLFDLISKNVDGKKFNVFVTYGTHSRPNKKGYLGLRYFNFIEPAGVDKTRLKVTSHDLMERINPDASSTTLDANSVTTKQNWI